MYRALAAVRRSGLAFWRHTWRAKRAKSKQLNCLALCALLLAAVTLVSRFSWHNRVATCKASGSSECGFPGISEQTCVDVGCCFRVDLGRQRCLSPKSVTVAPLQDKLVCPSSSAARHSCGTKHTTSTECYESGCCFSPAQEPRCYFPIAHPDDAKSFNGPLISIVMPCYKQSEYISAAIASVLKQKYRNWELIVVDDGTPGFACADAARAQLTSVTINNVLVLEKQNGGLADARNYGISHTNGTYLAMLDADDVLWPNYLYNVAGAVATDPTLDIVYADQAFFGTPGHHQNWFLVPNMTLAYASQRGPFPVIAVYSRRIYELSRGYRIDMIYGNEDYVFWLDLLQLGALSRKVTGVSSWYRLKAESMRTEAGYVALAPAMTVSHNPVLYASADPRRVCQAMAEIYCKMHVAADASRLYEATMKQPHSCYGWLWLALFKVHSACSVDALSVINRGLSACSVLDSSGSVSAHTAQLLVLRQWLTSSTVSGRFEYAAQLHRDCTLTFDQSKCGLCMSQFAELLDCDRNLAFYLHQPPPHNLAISQAQLETPIHGKLENVVIEALNAPLPVLPVPRLIHFVYGLADERFPAFHMYHYIALRSAFEVNAPVTIFFHYIHEPRGYWFEQALAFITLKQHEHFVEHEGSCLAHHAHKADVLRLQVLHEYGGIYMDIDTVSLRPWDPLLNKEFVMGWQDSSSHHTVREGKRYGLCNAAMVSAKGSRFAKLWLRSYAYFRSNGRDRFWDEHSVILPANLTEAYPLLLQRNIIQTINSDHMWKPLWTTIQEELFDRAPYLGFNTYTELLAHFPRSYMLHLWVSDGAKHTQLLEKWEHEKSWFDSTRYGAIARQYVEPEKRYLFGSQQSYRGRPLKLKG